MEPNEMERWDNPDDNGWMNPHSNGDWVRYDDAIEVITTLQTKIDNMVEKPNVDVGVPITMYDVDVEYVPVTINGKSHLFELATWDKVSEALGLEDGKV